MKRIFVFSLALLLCLFMAACVQSENDPTPASDTTSSTETTTETTSEPPTELQKKDWNVTAIDDTQKLFFDDGNNFEGIEINGFLVVTDEDGLQCVNTKSKQKKTILKEDYVVYAFDGKTVLYCQRRDDPTVKFDRSYLFENEEGEAVPADVYTIDDVMEYDIATEKTTKLFSKYCAGGGFVYYNENAVYYSDIKESQIGYRNGYDPYDLTLYCFDRKTGERQPILDNSFETRMKEFDGKPCIEMKDGVYDISTAKPEKVFDVKHGNFQWTDGAYVYSMDPAKLESGKHTVWALKISDKTEEKLLEFEITEEMQYTEASFGDRYVLCGVDVTREENEYTVTYGSTIYHVYDLLKREAFDIDLGEYDSHTIIDNVIVTWTDLGNNKYQISYYDDDGNLETYKTINLKNELYSITADGYYEKTGETEEGEPILEFVSDQLEFFK